ncbi:DUF2637 domain-containing protein [Streptomonospora arabica]|uniref:DUF2637 domain-containing protein n=1 Tax=Streptomonospora arabica TaxID=412417 RepID=A0ABV9SNA8_9ACTN
MFELALRHGEPAWRAGLFPVSVDGMIVAASLSLLSDARQGRRRGSAAVVLGAAGPASSRNPPGAADWQVSGRLRRHVLLKRTLTGGSIAGLGFGLVFGTTGALLAGLAMDRGRYRSHHRRHRRCCEWTRGRAHRVGGWLHPPSRSTASRASVRRLLDPPPVPRRTGAIRSPADAAASLRFRPSTCPTPGCVSARFVRGHRGGPPRDRARVQGPGARWARRS